MEPASEGQDTHPFLAARRPHQRCLMQPQELVRALSFEPAMSC